MDQRSSSLGVLEGSCKRLAGSVNDRTGSEPILSAAAEADPSSKESRPGAEDRGERLKSGEQPAESSTRDRNTLSRRDSGTSTALFGAVVDAEPMLGCGKRVVRTGNELDRGGAERGSGTSTMQTRALGA